MGKKNEFTFKKFWKRKSQNLKFIGALLVLVHTELSLLYKKSSATSHRGNLLFTVFKLLFKGLRYLAIAVPSSGVICSLLVFRVKCSCISILNCFLPFRSPSMKLTFTSPYLILLPLICVHGFIMEGNENALLSDVR